MKSKIKKIALTLILVIAAIHVVHALTLDRIVEYREVTFSSPRWPAALDGYRIAFVTDVHTTSDESLYSIVAELNDRQLDLLLLGGDFSLHGGRYRQSLAILSQTETTDGIFGVEGNHDDHVRLFAAKEYYGIVPLSNSGLIIQDGFFLAGLEDLWNRRPCIATATADAQNQDFVLLLSHNPDVSMQQDTTGVDIILSGHTHGGQIAFFGIWAPYFTLRSHITAYGQRFKSGWSSSRDGVPVYVSKGTGVYYFIPRIFARQQVIIFTMKTEHPAY